jgi:hypothetical protein
MTCRRTFTVCGSGCFDHLTHNRAVVVRDTVITRAAAHGSALALRNLHTPETPSRVLGVKDCSSVTAIAALPHKRGFVTGDLRGEIDSWSWDGEWRPDRLHPGFAEMGENPLPGRTYYRDSIVGSVSVHDRTIAATASGYVRTFAAGGMGKSTLPRGASDAAMGRHRVEARRLWESRAMVIILDIANA